MVQRTKDAVRRRGIARLVIGVPRATSHIVKESCRNARRTRGGLVPYAFRVIACRQGKHAHLVRGGLVACRFLKSGEPWGLPSQVAPRQGDLVRLLH